MKAISLHQPYASLIAAGVKKVETRGWATPYRGLLAIHAAKRWTSRELLALVNLRGKFSAVLESVVETPPLGALVAVARLVDCRAMTLRPYPGGIVIGEQTELERAVGGWAPGRYGWVLEDVRRLDPPIPLRGRQGLFDVRGTDLPYEAVVRLGEALA